MKAQEIIALLEKLKAEHGDFEVEVRNGAGEFDFVGAVDATHYGMPGDIKWRFFIDT